MKSFSTNIILLLVYLNYTSLSSQGPMSNPFQDQYRIQIKETTDDIKIDGKLDESVWQTTVPVSDFWMSFPIDTRKADEEYRTEVMMTYDEKNIYIAAICHGEGPYVMPSLKRDAQTFWQGDAFAFMFDPVNEKTNAFSFGINTAGVQTESLISGGTALRGGSGSSVINTAWDNTWVGEVTVRQDRWVAEIAVPFKTLRFSAKDIWGVNFIRGVSKKNEWHTWSPVPVQNMGIDLSFTGAMIWDKPPKPSKRNISVIPYSLVSTFKDFDNNGQVDNNFQVGGDAKIALSSSLNLDLTINPDFSQVDVDEQVTNLTTVNIRFPERRLFFLENSDIFSDIGIPPMRPFFSRKIGLDDDGNPIPIAYGARLSGNINKDLRIGVMNLQTKSTAEFLGQNYTSISINQQVFGRSVLKAYLHNRQAFSEGDFLGDNYNRQGGLEFNYRSEDGQWRATGGYGQSWSPGLSGDNYFFNAILSYNDRTFNFYTNVAGVGNNYRADMGFIPRFNHYDAAQDTTYLLGFQHGFTRASYRILPKDNSVINSHSFSFRNVFDFTQDGWDLIQNNFSIGYSLNWANTSSVSVEFSRNRQGLLFPFAFTSENPLPTGTYSYNFIEFEYQSDSRKPLSFELGYQTGGFYNGDRSEYSLGLDYRAQPWGNFSLNFVYNDLVFPEEFGATELFLISPKLEFNFSRSLFWTTFLQYNTQRENFNINSRLQYRFKPQSDLFIVYTDNYATDMWGPKNRGIVLKMNYWINL